MQNVINIELIFILFHTCILAVVQFWTVFCVYPFLARPVCIPNQNNPFLHASLDRWDVEKEDGSICEKEILLGELFFILTCWVIDFQIG